MSQTLQSIVYLLITFPYRLLRWMMLARPIRFTRFGTFYILFSIAVGAAAINTGNNLLYLILGMLLGFIVISGFLSDSAHWGISATWMPLGSLYVGEKALFEGTLYKGFFPGVAITVESRWTGLPPQPSFVPWIPSRSSSTTRLQLTPPKRGYFILESCRYSTRFPFGLFQKSHTENIGKRWIVYPSFKRLPLDLFVRQGQDPSPRLASQQGSGSLPFILRDYRTGDALRQINWKMSAKRQHLIVKEMEEETGEGDLFYLESWPTQLSTADMEAFISFIASLVFSVYEYARPIGLATPERLFTPEHSRQQLLRIFEFLALIDPFIRREQPLTKLPLEWRMSPVELVSLWGSYGKKR